MLMAANPSGDGDTGGTTTVAGPDAVVAPCAAPVAALVPDDPLPPEQAARKPASSQAIAPEERRENRISRNATLRMDRFAGGYAILKVDFTSAG